MAQAEAAAADPTGAVDLDAEVTQCPACEGEFAPPQLAETEGRCPNCGLRLAGG